MVLLRENLGPAGRRRYQPLSDSICRPVRDARQWSPFNGHGRARHPSPGVRVDLPPGRAARGARRAARARRSARGRGPASAAGARGGAADRGARGGAAAGRAAGGAARAVPRRDLLGARRAPPGPQPTARRPARAVGRVESAAVGGIAAGPSAASPPDNDESAALRRTLFDDYAPRGLEVSDADAARARTFAEALVWDMDAPRRRVEGLPSSAGCASGWRRRLRWPC